MTWEEIGKRYEQDVKTLKPDRKLPKLEKNWDSLVRSTDKLVWLFSISNSRPRIKR
ncbi:MAG: hypothetical protein M0011_01010 [Elusimicrobia bacterium]|nr:hypothetical protein [Elusimicrobiota bacterium]